MSGQKGFPGRVAIQQRVLPAYRVPFFDRLASLCSGGVEVFAGDAAANEGVQGAARLETASQHKAQNRHLAQGSLYTCWQHGLKAWLQRFQPDVLIVSADPRLLSNYGAVRLMKSWRRPVIGWGLGLQTWSAPGWVSTARRRFLRRFCGQFDVMVTYSRRGALDYQSLGVPESRVVVAPNSVSSEGADRLRERLDEDPGLVQEWKAVLSLSDKPVILYVGRLVAQKRVADLIQACSDMNGACELLIVGDGPERPRLEALAQSSFPDTRFLGHRSGDDLAMCFAAADLFVLPGSGGLALQEAMSHGKPAIIASGDGTEADLVKDGHNGYHVPAGDVFVLRKLLADVIADSGRLKEMGRRSREIVENGHNLDAMVDAFLDALDLVSSPRVAAVI